MPFQNNFSEKTSIFYLNILKFYKLFFFFFWMTYFFILYSEKENDSEFFNQRRYYDIHIGKHFKFKYAGNSFSGVPCKKL